MMSSDDEIAVDPTNTVNKVAGTVETKLAAIKNTGLGRNDLIKFESQLLGEY